MTKPPSFFESKPGLYDALVDWPKRLANEEPFYRGLFAEVGAQSVLDTACGTGRHAALFHSWGLQVQGADSSPGMIGYCRQTLGEPARLTWAVRSFDQPAAPGDPRFDVVLCVGNSLALAGDSEACRRAVAAMMSWLRPGGVLVIQVLNIWRIPEGPTTWQPARHFFFEKERYALLRGLHRVGGRGYLNIIAIRQAPDAFLISTDNAVFLGLEPESLIDAAESAGGSSCQVVGSFQRDPYERSSSQDLILICRK